MDKETAEQNGLELATDEQAKLSRQVYYSALIYLYQRHIELAALLDIVGDPIYITSDSPVRAGAFYNHETEDAALLINTNLFEHQTDYEAAGVLAHEALHFYLGHHKFHCTNETLDQLFGIAADAVINDRIRSHNIPLPDSAIHGEKLIGKDCRSFSVEDVLEVLLARIGYIDYDHNEVANKLTPRYKQLDSLIPKAAAVEIIQ